MKSLPAFRLPARRLPLTLLAGALAVSLAGCGDDGPSGPDGEISQAQAEKVASAVNTAAGQAFSAAAAEQSDAGSLVTAALAPAASTGTVTRAATYDWSFENSADCQPGGTVTVDGDGTIETTEDASSVSWDWSSQVGYDGCTVETEDGLFTLTTPSPLQFAGTGQVTTDEAGGGSGSFDWSLTGTVDWDEQGGPSGTCDLDLDASLDIEATQTSASATGSVTGSVCGHSIERNWDGTLTLGS